MTTINAQRIRQLKNGIQTPGPIAYWMSRDQRAQDNWALLSAQQLALARKQSLLVVSCLSPVFGEATLRQYAFMLKGLSETAQALSAKNISFHVLFGDPPSAIAKWLQQVQAGILVTDFDPLKIKQHWKKTLLSRIDIPCFEVDAHNIVPCWIASPKQEYGAYTIRPKIQRLLPSFLEEIPPLQHHPFSAETIPSLPQWDNFLTSCSTAAPEVTWLQPGSRAAQSMLDSFIQHKLSDYDTQRNDPTQNAQSNLSPYLHFGQISAQRVALSILHSDSLSSAREAFLEELIVRRELADNFCYYNQNYDQMAGFPAWARETLDIHRSDIRDHLYTRHQLEAAETHDDLWNAAQTQLLITGKLHGYLRMYWAKKILEWSQMPEEALAAAIYLNDKYQLDGRDPNGYAGIAWSIGGVHDRAWNQRPVFGKIRYMSYNGMKKKFSIKQYISAQQPGGLFV